MREIKFRGMTDNGEWVYGLLSNLMGHSDPLACGWYISNRAGKPFAYLVRPETRGQFTGLKDKNGKEIYEDDIVGIRHPFKGRKWKGPVIWKGYGFSGDGFFFTHFDQPGWLFSEGTEYIKVIGNIHENPELLEVK